jgi:hypothetical protein
MVAELFVDLPAVPAFPTDFSTVRNGGSYRCAREWTNVERRSHEQLVALGGKYAELFLQPRVIIEL